MTPNNVRTFGWGLALVFVAVATAMAHLAVTKTMPDGDAALAESPDQLQVWFTQDPDPAVSKLTLQGSDGEVALGDTVVADQKSLVAAVSTELSPGSYTVRWRSAGDDGHVRRGDFVFTLRGTN